MTKEQVYQKQMEELGIWQEIFLPELRTLCRCERELTRAEKAWSQTAPPGGKPSFLDEHWPVIQKLRAEILQHREALGLTPKALRKLTGAGGSEGSDPAGLISSKLDQIAARVAGYDEALSSVEDWKPVLANLQPKANPFSGIPAAEDAARISDLMDEELRRAVHEDMG